MSIRVEMSSFAAIKILRAFVCTDVLFVFVPEVRRLIKLPEKQCEGRPGILAQDCRS